MKLLLLKKLHKWVALFVGLQLLLWTISGLVFAWTDHHDVQGHNLVTPLPAQTLEQGEELLEPLELMLRLGLESASEIRLLTVDGQWAYRIVTPTGVQLHDAGDGEQVVITARRAAAVAQALYAGKGSLLAIEQHPGPTLETRKSGPTWEARFADDSSTSIYVSAVDGAFVAARGDSWRLFDFFWMLHTMDYVGRDDFNNPLVILAAAAAGWIALTGLLLVIRVFRPTGGSR
jgi:uncharacterized iron-regulated membrane protein